MAKQKKHPITITSNNNNMKQGLWAFIGLYLIFITGSAFSVQEKFKIGDVENSVTSPIGDGINILNSQDLGMSLEAKYGYVDVTLKKFGADPTGIRDSTTALNQALEYARKKQMVTYLPSGTYIVTDTIECVQGYYRRTTGVIHQARLHPCVMVGSRKGSRPKILLQKSSKGFNLPDQPKPVVHFWTRAGLYRSGSTRNEHVGAVSMNQMFVNIDIEVSDSNIGAIGIALYGAQGTGIEESRIDVRHGFIGIQGGSGSGGSVIDIEVIGGSIGLDYREAQPVPLVVNAKLSKQTDAAILYTGRQTLTLVGGEIISTSGKPVIVGSQRKLQPHWGQVSLVDTVVIFENPAGSIIDSYSSFTMNNVYMKGSRNITSTGLRVDKSILDANWILLKQVAMSINPRSLQGYQYTMPIYVNKTIQKSPLVIAVAYDRDPSSVLNKHTFRQLIPEFSSGEVVNVKEKPYFAKGDGITDDTTAIQQAVISGKSIFFPKGYYNITDTINVPQGVKLFGVARHLSIITTSGFKGDKKNRPLIRVGEGKGEANLLAFMGLMPPKEMPEIYALDWKASAESVVRNVNIFSKYLKGYSSPLIRKTIDRVIPLVKVTGAGQWFNFFQEEPRKQASSYRHILVKDVIEKLVFYGLNLEHARSDCNGEIINSKNIFIYALKAEGNHTILCVSDTEELYIFGFGGNTSAFPGKALLSFDNVSRYLLTNLVTHHRPVGAGSLHVFSGLMYAPDRWVMLQVMKNKMIEWKTQPLERPAIVNSGHEY